MSVLIWNIRGAGNPKSLLYLLKIITQRKPQIVAILEPKQQVNKITKIAQQIGYKNYTHGNPLNPYIWVFWRDEVNWQTLEIHPQCLTTEVVIPNIFSGKLTFVYAKCNRQERLPLWDYLSHHSSDCHEPWVIGGDFNVIKTLDEKQGGSNAHMTGMQDFNDFLVDARLTDAGFVGNIFTWSNNQRGQNRIWQRLDRILLNAEAFTAISARVDHLPRLESDHCPLLLNFGQLQTKPSRFYFQKMWTEHHNYQEFVASIWQQIIHGGRANFESELANLRKALRKWNWEVFGKLEDNISSMQSNIADMEARLSHAWEDDLFTECQKEKTDLV
ncbi:PREDICTED: uncharacterized protein LOC105966965 [Erythranthe guttata]|uniref:uncharacterized protein LOC105966965 n=1 Tax=Erythranthe guttata TaxID=4155 RepID=UPI00064D8EDE|nr:PREDICTED: uncharacterized protein LOC105966965 [Erythranthe guttata]|eukprot:XP_012846985.1 PREDICTED: uncharacterized protein LOC105966965 [Erythranthe guttata]